MSFLLGMTWLAHNWPWILIGYALTSCAAVVGWVSLHHIVWAQQRSRSSARRGWAWLGVAWQGMAWNAAWPGKARRGLAWFGSARYGSAGRGMAWQGMGTTDSRDSPRSTYLTAAAAAPSSQERERRPQPRGA